MRLFSILVFIVLFIFSGFALSAPVSNRKFYLIHYTVIPEDTFAGIISRFVKSDSIINKFSQMITKTRAENIHIKNWRKLKKGQIIRLFIDEAFTDIAKLKNFEKRLLAQRKRKNKVILATRKKFRYSVFYMASAGSFNQSNENSMSISFSQNSFITLGGALHYFPKDKIYYWSSSFYLSRLNAAGNNLNDFEISVTPEMGINLYFSYNLPKRKFGVYGGIDIETFSTFNLDVVSSSQKFTMNDHQVTYLTVGLDKTVMLYKKPYYLKLSFSQSVMSYYSFDSNYSNPGVSYSGSKFLFYINRKISKKFFSHFMYKYHSMSGADHLVVNRIGVGVGYIF